MYKWKYCIAGLAIATSQAYAEKIFEWNDPVQGNFPPECSASSIYSSGGGGYLYKEYQIECPSHSVTVDWVNNTSTNTCTVDATTLDYSTSVSNCENWRVYYDGQSMPDESELDGDFAAPSSFISPTGYNGGVWTYTTAEPSSNWMQPNYATNGWSTGYAGFYSGSTRADEENNTPFSDNLWLRKTVSLTSNDIAELILWGRWDDSIEVYLNGVLATQKGSWVGNYQYIGISDASRQALQPGANVIAVKVVDSGAPGFFDMGVAVAPQIAQALGSPPVVGYARNAQFAVLNDFIKNKITEALVPAAAVAVARQRASDGEIEIMYSAGFGYMEKQFLRPVRQDAVFRLASLDKSPSFAALKRMMIGQASFSYNNGIYTSTCNPSANQNNPNAVAHPNNAGEKLSCDDSVQEIMEALNVVEPLDVPDTRIANVTVADILGFSGNFTYRPSGEANITNYYNHLGITSDESSPQQLMRWYFTNPLIRDPGNGPYNSDGAAIARFMVDRLGNGFENYMQNEFLEGLPRKDLYIAHERIEDRVKYSDGLLREPWYRTGETPFHFWVGLDNALAIAASAETAAVANFRYDPNSRSWNGGMAGSQTGMRNWFINGDRVSVVWLNNSGGLNFDFGASDNDMNQIRTILNSLPANAWESERAPIRHTSSGRCIHPLGGSGTPSNGTPAVVWNGCGNEPRLTFEYSARGSLMQESSAMCLHPEGGSSTPAVGTRLVYWNSCDEPRLEFRVMLSGQLQHITSGLCVVPSGSYDGAELVLANCVEGSPGQKFAFAN